MQAHDVLLLEERDQRVLNVPIASPKLLGASSALAPGGRIRLCQSPPTNTNPPIASMTIIQARRVAPGALVAGSR